MAPSTKTDTKLTIPYIENAESQCPFLITCDALRDIERTVRVSRQRKTHIVIVEGLNNVSIATVRSEISPLLFINISLLTCSCDLART